MNEEKDFLQADSDYQRYLEFKSYGDKLSKTLFAKNTDYGNAIAETGKSGCEVRLYDKLKRLRNIIENGENAVEGEPLVDAFWDTAGYAILWLMIHEKSTVFYDKLGNVIETNGTQEKRKEWLQKQSKIIERLLKD
jgi:hypothetical protein